MLEGMRNAVGTQANAQVFPQNFRVFLSFHMLKGTLAVLKTTVSVILQCLVSQISLVRS